MWVGALLGVTNEFTAPVYCTMNKLCRLMYQTLPKVLVVASLIFILVTTEVSKSEVCQTEAIQIFLLPVVFARMTVGSCTCSILLYCIVTDQSTVSKPSLTSFLPRLPKAWTAWIAREKPQERRIPYSRNMDLPIYLLRLMCLWVAHNQD